MNTPGGPQARTSYRQSREDAPEIPALLWVLICLLTGVLFLSIPASAQDLSRSASFGTYTSIDVLPLLGAGTSVEEGPIPFAEGEAPPAYTQNRQVLSSGTSVGLLGDIVSTGEINARVDGIEQELARGEVSIDGLELSIVGKLPLVTLTAGTIDSLAEVSGPCSSGLDTALSARFENAVLDGSLVPRTVIPLNPAPNTVLLDLAGIRIVLNEQAEQGDAAMMSQGRVNAIHVYLNNVSLSGLGVLNGEIIVGHALARMECDEDGGGGGGPDGGAAANLAMSLTDSPDPAFEGSLVYYQATVDNAGPDLATGVIATVALPSNVSLFALETSQGFCSLAGDDVICELGAVAPGAAAVIDIQVQTQLPGTLEAVASVTSDVDDPDLSDNTAIATTEVQVDSGGGPKRADLQVVGSGWPGLAVPGTEVAPLLTVRNAGAVAAENVDFGVDLPPGLVLKSLGMPSQGSCSPGQTVACDLGTIPPGGSVTLKLFVRYPQPGALLTQATAASSTEDADLSDNTYSAFTQVQAPANADTASCRIGVQPSATLLMPYFAVDLDNPQGQTTLFSVTNARAESHLVKVTMWTDWAVPSLSFDVYLTGYDVQTFNVRDLLAGRLPRTGSALSAHGLLSGQPASFRGCGGGGAASATAYEPLPPAQVQHLEAWHTGGASALSGDCASAPRPGNTATGYITIDVVNECSQLLPSDSGYFISGGRGVASNENAIWGDFFLVNPAQDLAQGETAVHLIADEEQYDRGPTFYGRYVNGGGADNRQPLGTRYGVRFANGGVFDGNTQLLVWRDTRSGDAEPRACGSSPAWFPLGIQSPMALDEEENASLFASDAASTGLIASAVQQVDVGTLLPTPEPFGWVILDFQTDSAQAVSGPGQAWVIPVMSAQNRFSVSFRPVRLDAECGY